MEKLNDADLLREIFRYIPGHCLMLRLVCRSWSRVPFDNPVTYYANVLGGVETFKLVALELLSHPKMIYKYASYEVIMYLKSQHVDLSILRERVTGNYDTRPFKDNRYADYKLYSALSNILKKSTVQAVYLTPDFAATPPEQHEDFLKLLRTYNRWRWSSSGLIHARFDMVFDIDAEMVRQLYPHDRSNNFGNSTYFDFWAYTFGWSSEVPTIRPTSHIDLCSSGYGLYPQIFGYESYDVCARFLEMIDGTLDLNLLNVSRNAANHRGLDMLTFYGNLYARVDELLAAGFVIDVTWPPFNVVPARIGRSSMEPQELFFLAASLDDYKRCGSPQHVGCVLGAIHFDNLPVLMLAGAPNAIWMHLAVGMERFKIAKWLYSRGIPICGKYPADDKNPDMFQWMVDNGWGDYADNRLSPRQILVLVKARRLHVSNSVGRLKTLRIWREEKELNRDGDLWKLLDYLVRNNYIYPSLLDPIIKPQHRDVLRGWERAGFATKRTQPAIAKARPQKKKPVAPLTDGDVRYLQNARLYIRNHFDGTFNATENWLKRNGAIRFQHYVDHTVYPVYCVLDACNRWLEGYQ